MKSRIAKIAGAGSVFLGAIFFASYWMAGEIDEDRYLPLIAIVGELQQLTTRWNTELSHVKSNTDANFDGLVEIKSDIRRLETEFQEAMSLIPDLPEQVSTAAHTYVSAITAKQQRVERFTRSYALVDTSKQILPLARADVMRTAHADEEQEVAWAVMNLMGELDAFLYQPSEETRRSAGASLEALSVESAGRSEALDAALKTLLSHTRALLERYLHTEALFAQALSDDASVRGGALLDELEQLVSRARATRKPLEFAMAGTVAVWLGMWIVLALRARRRVSEEIPTRDYAQDSSEEIHTTQQQVERHEPAEWEDSEFSFADFLALETREEALSGLEKLVERAGREETARAGGASGEIQTQRDVFDGIVKHVVARSLLTLARNARASVDVLEEARNKTRMRSTTHAGAPETQTGFEEEIAAISEVQEKLRSQAEYLAALAGRLRWWRESRVEGRYEMFDVNECIREAVADVSTDASVEVITKLGAVPDIFAARKEIETMLAAVLDNAMRGIEASDAAEGIIRIETSEAGGMVSVTTIDNGIGIAPERLDRILNPFYTTREDAVGIGLTVTNILANKYGGNVEVNSVLDEGTLVRFTLSSGTRMT